MKPTYPKGYMTINPYGKDSLVENEEHFHVCAS